MSDEELIQEIVNGNDPFFRNLIEKYQTMVFRTAMGFVHSKEDAEDITQDVFVFIFNSLDSFQYKSTLSTWIYRITLNTSINFVNKHRVKNFFVGIEDTLTTFFHRTPEHQDPHAQLEEEELKKSIKNAIDTLNDKQKTAFVLSRYDDLPQREIAEIMGISEGAVEQLLQRAKTNLRKKLRFLE